MPRELEWRWYMERKQQSDRSVTENEPTNKAPKLKPGPHSRDVTSTALGKKFGIVGVQRPPSKQK
jgi:hypothetical protein